MTPLEILIMIILSPVALVAILISIAIITFAMIALICVIIGSIKGIMQRK